MNYSVNIITTDNKLIKLGFKPYEYANLMEIIINTYYEDIGECLGKGLCGTCHVKLKHGTLNDPISAVEKDTLNKTYNTDSRSRLACQIILDKKINNLTFKIITDNL